MLINIIAVRQESLTGVNDVRFPVDNLHVKILDIFV